MKSIHGNNCPNMIAFPNAKINLGLKVVSKRPDGYHNLDTVFFPIPFYDILEII
jgi:4-diphosphocytidyl-2-C-methyl-D-erythritol kinase